MGRSSIPPDPLQLASSVRQRLERLVPLARTGCARDLDLAVASLEAAIGELGALTGHLASVKAAPSATAHDGKLRQELETCRRISHQLAQLLEQAREVRLAHWTPESGGTYTAHGHRSPAAGPRLVRQLG